MGRTEGKGRLFPSSHLPHPQRAFLVHIKLGNKKRRLETRRVRFLCVTMRGLSFMIVLLCCFWCVFSSFSDWVCCLYGQCKRQSAGSMPPLMCLHDLCKHSEDRSWTLSRLPTKHHWRYTRVSSLIKDTQTGMHSTDTAHLVVCTRCRRIELSRRDRHFDRW